jgi:translation elongation factor EF-G
MNEVTQITKAIQTKREEIAGIKSELARCETCIAAVAETKEALAALKLQRREALTAAFMAGKEADTSEVDKLIKAAEKAASGAADTAAGAEGAKDVLQERLEIAEDELQRLISEQRTVAYGAIEKEFEQAEIAYSEAAEALHAAVTKMMACNAAAGKFRRGSDGGSPLRAIVKGFYSDGLNINRGRRLPESFGLRFLSRAEEKAGPEAERLIAKLQAEGLELIER